MTALAASAAVYPAQAHSCRAAEGPRWAFVARARLYKSRCDQPRAAAQPATPVAVAVAAAASGGRRQRRQRLHAAVGQAQAVEERHGDWVLTVQTGYVEKAVAISRLLAQSFAGFEELYDTEAPQPSPAQVLQYQLKLLAALQWRASTLGRGLLTITATDARTGELAGAANVTTGLALAEAVEHVELEPGQAAATVSNMAVAEKYRRRGLGRLLLEACERAAVQCSPPATLMALVVYRYNDPAISLYETSGFLLDETWTDLKWAEAAERGRAGGARRQLMLKPLNGAPWPRTRPALEREKEEEEARDAAERRRREARQAERERQAGQRGRL